MILTSFEFVLILHLIKRIMRFTNSLCQALQQNSQDILNVISAVSTTKLFIQKLRNEEWGPFLDTVKSFLWKKKLKLMFLI
jgi:hypothetical protein